MKGYGKNRDGRISSPSLACDVPIGSINSRPDGDGGRQRLWQAQTAKCDWLGRVDHGHAQSVNISYASAESRTCAS